MARAPQRAFWWRFIAPSVLVPLLGIGFLPIIEAGQKGPPDSTIVGKKVGPSGKLVTVTQNAYQTTWGGHSWGPEIAADMEEAERKQKQYEKEHAAEIAEAKKQAEQWAKDHAAELEQLKKDAEKWAKDNGADLKEANKKDEPGAAPMMIIYFIVLLAAVAVGYAFPLGRVRVLAFAGTATLATLILAVQTAIGFPLANWVQEKGKAEAKQQEQADKFVQGLGVKAPKSEGPKYYCALTALSVLAWPFLVGAVVAASGEELLATRGGGAGPKKKSRAADDDDDDDDEDDRPRKKGRARDEDDDDDEPPRKKKGRAGADDEDGGRKSGVKKKARTYHDDD